MAALIAGAGDSTGLALARHFASKGLVVFGARRRPDATLWPTESPLTVPKPSPTADAPTHTHAHEAAAAGVSAAGLGRVEPIVACDFRDEDAVEALVSRIEERTGPLRLAVHNIGANVRFPLGSTTARVYRKTWELAGLSAFNFAKAVGPRMARRGEGTLIFTGATASVRGGAGYAAFSGAMAAKRMLAQAAARELGPEGVHVAHVVVDGPIDTPFVRELMGEAEYAQLKQEEGLVQPAAIAELYWRLHCEPKCAWTHETDLRPFCEKF